MTITIIFQISALYNPYNDNAVVGTTEGCYMQIVML